MSEAQESIDWRKQEDYFSSRDNNAPILSHWKDFVETWKLSGKSIQTVRNVASTLLILVGNWFCNFSDWDLSVSAFRKMHDIRVQYGWSAVTFNTHRKNMNTYFAFLLRKGIRENNPIHKIEKMHEKQFWYPIVNVDEFKKIMEYLRVRKTVNMMEKKRNTLFFMLLWETGARPQEILSLRLNNVENRKEIRIDGIKLGWRPRNYQLSPQAQEILHDYIRESASLARSSELSSWLFLWIKKGNSWSYSGVRKLLDHINREAGTRIKITCYSFRRNVATTLFRRKMPLQDISKFLGHTRPSTTMRYIQDLAEINSEWTRIMSEWYGSILSSGF